MATKEKNLREGGLKSLMLAVAGMFITFSAEAYRVGDLRTAAMLSVAGVVAYAVHEAMSQYQFAFADDFANMVATTGIIESEPAEDTDDTSE